VLAAPDPWAGKLRKTKVNGAQLAYLDIGKGQPIVLVHGALSDYRQWTPQIEALSKRYRIIAYSRRYHYPNPPANDRSDYSYAVNEADLVGLIRSLRLGKVHLLGHGYGGFVATLIARDHPEVVRTLILAEPGVYSMIPWKKDRRAAVDGLKAAAASSGDAVRAGDPERAAKQFYAVVQGSAGAFDSLPEPQRRIMRDNAGTLLLGIESPPAFPCEQVHRIAARTLLIEGDAATRNEHGAIAGLDRCLPNRTRALIKNASRVVNRGNPDAFNDAVVQFLEAPEAPVHLPEDEP
jgi:pimeloyl-ACP methyl ester carboxylesterase